MLYIHPDRSGPPQFPCPFNPRIVWKGDLHHMGLNWDHTGCRKSLNHSDFCCWMHEIQQHRATRSAHHNQTAHFLHIQISCDGNREDPKNFLVFTHLSINERLKTWEPKSSRLSVSPSLLVSGCPVVQPVPVGSSMADSYTLSPHTCGHSWHRKGSPANHPGALQRIPDLQISI